MSGETHSRTCSERAVWGVFRDCTLVSQPHLHDQAVKPNSLHRNAPYILGFRSVAYALAVGNTCILKGSETSPRCHLAIGSVFKEAGLPDGVLNIIFHRPQDAAEITAALIEHTAIRKINFTGSTAVGRIVAATAGKNLKPVLMELGGKASAIVCQDADIQKAAMQCSVGAFLHVGTRKSTLRPVS